MLYLLRTITEMSKKASAWVARGGVPLYNQTDFLPRLGIIIQANNIGSWMGRYCS